MRESLRPKFAPLCISLVKMSAIFVFTDMQDSECAVGNPLPNSVFTLFDVAIAFGCHILTPFNTCLLIVV